MYKVMVISIKPEFAEKIFKGEKSIELRKATPNISPGDLVIIYCTIPIKAVIGFCKVENILKMPPSKLWRKYSRQLGIDKRRFFSYYENTNIAIGIALTEIYRLDANVPLDSIRRLFPAFAPPQTFRYYDKNTFLKNIYPSIERTVYAFQNSFSKSVIHSL